MEVWRVALCGEEDGKDNQDIKDNVLSNESSLPLKSL